jgi:phenylpropionate dioxygenase-like ring-hydroxylating dioxygenase large terminal subunit
MNARRPEFFDPSALVRPDQIHRDLYLSEDVFALEMQRLWARSWLFVGHESQVPEPGDAYGTTLAGQPVAMVRGHDGVVRVLLNRCAHKGTPLVPEGASHAGRTLRCPYHAWSYRLDGTLLGVPQREGLEGTGFDACPGAQGLAAYGEVAVHRGFVFARALADAHAKIHDDASAGASGFRESMGELLQALDLLADRSPEGRLRVAGGVLRTTFEANWKIYLENINDAFHPISTHVSVTASAERVWRSSNAEHDGGTDRTGPSPSDAAPPPLAMRQLLPFGSGYDFFKAMGARVLPHGHSLLGTRHSIHTGYADLGDYGLALHAAHGEARTAQVLAFAPQNVVFYPSMALKGAPPVMRVLRPLSAGRTVLEAWAFEPVGAPPEVLRSALLYNRQVFSPMSMVAHDDLHLFEGIQRSLAARGNPWISLHRGAVRDAEGRIDERVPRDVDGLDEALLRNQYRAWAEGMKESDGVADVGPALEAPVGAGAHSGRAAC